MGGSKSSGFSPHRGLIWFGFQVGVWDVGFGIKVEIVEVLWVTVKMGLF